MVLYGPMSRNAQVKDCHAMSNLITEDFTWKVVFRALALVIDTNGAADKTGVQAEWVQLRETERAWDVSTPMELAQAVVRLAYKHRLMEVEDMPDLARLQCEVQQQDRVAEPTSGAPDGDHAKHKRTRITKQFHDAGPNRPAPKKSKVAQKRKTKEDPPKDKVDKPSTLDKPLHNPSTQPTPASKQSGAPTPTGATSCKGMHQIWCI